MQFTQIYDERNGYAAATVNNFKRESDKMLTRSSLLEQTHMNEIGNIEDPAKTHTHSVYSRIAI